MYISLVLDRIIIEIIYLLHLMEQFTRTFFLLRFSQGQYYISAGNNPLSCLIYTDILKIRNDITLVPT